MRWTNWAMLAAIWGAPAITQAEETKKESGEEKVVTFQIDVKSDEAKPGASPQEPQIRLGKLLGAQANPPGAPQVGQPNPMPRAINVVLKPRMEKAVWLGISTDEPDAIVRAQLGLNKGFGLVIHEVIPDSPAAKGGVKQFDVLQKLDDQLIVNREQLATLIRAHKEGDEVKLGVIHAAKAATLSIKLAEHEFAPETRAVIDTEEVTLIKNNMRGLLETVERRNPEIRQYQRLAPGASPQQPAQGWRQIPPQQNPWQRQDGAQHHHHRHHWKHRHHGHHHGPMGPHQGWGRQGAGPNRFWNERPDFHRPQGQMQPGQPWGPPGGFQHHPGGPQGGPGAYERHGGFGQGPFSLQWKVEGAPRAQGGAIGAGGPTVKTLVEGDRSFTLVAGPMGKTLIVNNTKTHQSVFHGPVGTKEERAAVPVDMKAMLEKLEKSPSVQPMLLQRANPSTRPSGEIGSPANRPTRTNEGNEKPPIINNR